MAEGGGKKRAKGKQKKTSKSACVEKRRLSDWPTDGLSDVFGHLSHTHDDVFPGNAALTSLLDTLHSIGVREQSMCDGSAAVMEAGCLLQACSGCAAVHGAGVSDNDDMQPRQKSSRTESPGWGHLEDLLIRSEFRPSMFHDIATAVSTGQKFATNQLDSRSIGSEACAAHLFTRSTDTPILNLVLTLLQQRLGGSDLIALFAERLGHIRSSNITHGSRSLATLIARRVFGVNLLRAIEQGMLVEIKRAISAQTPNSFMRSLQVMLHALLARVLFFHGGCRCTCVTCDSDSICRLMQRFVWREREFLMSGVQPPQATTSLLPCTS